MIESLETTKTPAGARFFDGEQRDLGWALRVTKRASALGNLTVLDVTTTEVGLADSLVALDRKRLFVRSCAPSGRCYAFAWASGYGNGRQIRIQGILEGL
jgi:hypothetical protein